MFTRAQIDRSRKLPVTGKRKLPLVVALGFALGLVLSQVVTSIEAQDRSVLIRRLESHADFRLRVQAAFALGNMGDARAVPALSRALGDPNPAIRASVATALGRIGSTRALPTLRQARSDQSAAVRNQVVRSIAAIEEAVRSSTASANRRRTGERPTIEIMPREDRIQWPRVRYVVTLGDMLNRTTFSSDTLETTLRAEVTRQLNVMRGVAVMQSEINIDDNARREMRRRQLPQLRLDGSIAQMRRQRRGQEVSVRCEISLMLLDGRRRALRGELRGAATGIEPWRRDRAQRAVQEQRLAQRALQGAVRSAMANAGAALERAVEQ